MLCLITRKVGGTPKTTQTISGAILSIFFLGLIAAFQADELSHPHKDLAFLIVAKPIKTKDDIMVVLLSCYYYHGLLLLLSKDDIMLFYQ